MKELIYLNIQNHLRQGKIQILLVSIVLLTVIITIIDLKQFSKEQDSYLKHIEQNQLALKENKVYGTIESRIQRKPNPLSVISKGIDSKVGNELLHSFDKVSIIPSRSAGTNEYTKSFLNIDVSTVLLWLLSLIGFLLTIDSISKEREDGTLSLLLVSGKSRFQILMSKLLSAIFILFFIIIALFVVILLVLAMSPYIILNTGLVLRIIACGISFILYGIFWILIGNLCSIIFETSATALIGSMTIWVCFVILVPGIIYLSLGDTMLSQNQKKISALKVELDKRLYDKGGKIFYKYIEPLVTKHEFGTGGGGISSLPVWYPNANTKESMHKFFMEYNELKKQSFEDLIKKEHLEYLAPIEEKNRTLLMLSMLSPLNLTDNLVQKVCQTAYEDYLEFISGFKNYRSHVLRYLEREDAFSSYQWFTPKVEKYYDGVFNDTALNLELDNFPTFNKGKKGLLALVDMFLYFMAYFVMYVLILFAAFKYFSAYRIK